MPCSYQVGTKCKLVHQLFRCLDYTFSYKWWAVTQRILADSLCYCSYIYQKWCTYPSCKTLCRASMDKHISRRAENKCVASKMCILHKHILANGPPSQVLSILNCLMHMLIHHLCSTFGSYLPWLGNHESSHVIFSYLQTAEGWETMALSSSFALSLLRDPGRFPVKDLQRCQPSRLPGARLRGRQIRRFGRNGHMVPRSHGP